MSGTVRNGLERPRRVEIGRNIPDAAAWNLFTYINSDTCRLESIYKHTFRYLPLGIYLHT